MEELHLQALLIFANMALSADEWHSLRREAKRSADFLEREFAEHGHAGSTWRDEILFALFLPTRVLPSYSQARKIQEQVRACLRGIAVRDRNRLKDIVRTINRGGHHGRELWLSPTMRSRGTVVRWPSWHVQRATGFRERLLGWIGDLMAEGYADRVFQCAECKKFMVETTKRKLKFCGKKCAQKWHTRRKVEAGYYEKLRRAPSDGSMAG
jgi:hypothetical protein